MRYDHRRPIAGFSGRESVARLFESVAILCQASQGSLTLLGALRRIGNQIGADATAICLVDLAPARQTEKVFCHAVKRPWVEDAGSFEVSFANAICGENTGSAKIGSVWRGTFDDFKNKERLASVYRDRRLAESIVIPLQRTNGLGDFLELHFCHPVSNTFFDHLGQLGPVLAGCWKDRSPGLFACSSLSRRPARPASPIDRPILSVENPCRLSRAEYRVCLMLSRGLNNKALLAELSVSMATLRTHLRNIYAKTDCGSQPELIHKLLSSDQWRTLNQVEDANVA